MDIIAPPDGMGITNCVSPEENGTLRLYMYFRKLNEVKTGTRIRYGTSMNVSTFQAVLRYFQHLTPTADIDKLKLPNTMKTRHYLRLTTVSSLYTDIFWIRNAPGSFQRAMDLLLSNYQWSFSIACLDDVEIFSQTLEEHIDNIQQGLTLLQGIDVKLNVVQCDFSANHIDYVCHFIRLGRLKVSKQAIDAPHGLQHPKNVTESGLLGLCNLFHQFGPIFALSVAPLNKKLHKSQLQTFNRFTDDKRTALETLRAKLENFLCWLLHAHKKTTQLTLAHATSGLHVSH